MALLPLSIRPYVQSTAGAKLLPGVAVVVSYNLQWSKLHFRLVNTDLCGGDAGANCTPRCVEVHRDAAAVPEAPTDFVYDGEVGFYPSETRMTATTSGNTYNLDLCVDGACGSYLFRMPEVEEISGAQDLILVNKSDLMDRQRLTLYLPQPLEATKTLSLLSNGSLVEEYSMKAGLDVVSFPIGGHLDKGIYEVAVNQEMVARFELIHEKDVVRLASVWVVIFLVFFTLITLLVYFKYVWIKKIQKVDLEQ